MKRFIGAGRLEEKCRAVILLLAVSLLLFPARVQSAETIQNESGKLTWGVAAINLGPAYAGTPSLDDLLSDSTHVVSLGRFYRAGGDTIPATPTDCRIACDTNGLLVVFRCTEKSLSFPAIRQQADWYAMLGSPSEQDSAFPDKVDLFVQPDPKGDVYYQFAVTLAGEVFGCRHQTHEASAKDDGEDGPGTAAYKKVTGFTATVTRRDRQWLVYLKIPWQIIGGKPRDGFGLLPVRTRWRNGEVSSPAAFYFIERAPVDLFVETHYADTPAAPPAVRVYASSLCQLPSGTWRWQRPALLAYPDADTRRQIWQVELSLSKPTDAGNFAQRLFLTQRWTDLLTLEGFNFRPAGGSIVKISMSPSGVRWKVNEALERNQAAEAWHLLDVYLDRLDRYSRDWFADGSPGDILTEAWQPVTTLAGWDVKDNVCSLHCRAGDHPVELHLALPVSGGVRIYDANEGYFKPAELQPLKMDSSAGGCSVETANGRVVVTKEPFAISFFDTAGNQIMRLGVGDLAFRFGPDDVILATDVKSDLAADEVIYGFGERYDHFNENGQVLTLWGMDDWFGNTVGLMNETYKPIALFHSSRGYTVFDNSTYRLRADIGGTQPGQYRLTQQGPVFDYYFWMTSPEKALISYTDLTGKPRVGPKWAFEPWIGRTGRGWKAGPLHNVVAEQESVVKKFAALDIPHSAIYSEGGGADSPELNQFMAARGIKVLSWYYPVISPDQQSALLPELKPAELPVLNAGSTNASRSLGYVDFSNPHALELSRRWWRYRLSLGVAGSMVDFGDRVPEEAVFYDGKRGAEMHNFYAYDYHRTYSETFREKRGEDYILFARAAAPGTQKWIAQFAGDHPANFAGLRGVLTGALNLSACGFSIWGSDLGGFLGWPEPAVYMRWTQFGCFSPLMRCHGRTPREPWYYGTNAVINYKFYTWVRENLLDYIYDSALGSGATGMPMMRSLAVAYPGDAPAAAVSDEYLFGNDLLVAPVLTDDDLRTITFPPGRWTSLWTGETVAGPAVVTTNVPLSAIPVYLKTGAVVPVQLNPSLKFGESMTPGRVKALVLTPPVVPQTTQLFPQGDATVVNAAVVDSRPVAGGFAVTLENLPEENHLLLYDAPVTGIKLDGQTLPALGGPPSDSVSPGWWNDPASQRVVVRLPAGRAQRTEMEIQLSGTKE